MIYAPVRARAHTRTHTLLCKQCGITHEGFITAAVFSQKACVWLPVPSPNPTCTQVISTSAMSSRLSLVSMSHMQLHVCAHVRVCGRGRAEGVCTLSETENRVVQVLQRLCFPPLLCSRRLVQVSSLERGPHTGHGHEHSPPPSLPSVSPRQTRRTAPGGGRARSWF